MGQQVCQASGPVSAGWTHASRECKGLLSFFEVHCCPIALERLFTDEGIAHTRRGDASRGLQTKHGLPPPLVPSWHQGTPRRVACEGPVSDGGGDT